MNGNSLQDRISRSNGIAARRLGIKYAVYRPKGPYDPLATRNRIITLHAAFTIGSDRTEGSSTDSAIFWRGVFDFAYTSPGDYLVCENRTFFVASQRPLLPVQCVLTNDRITISRSLPPATGGYFGMVAEDSEVIARGWPASMHLLHAHTNATPPDSRFGSYRILLPRLPRSPNVADILRDESGRTFSIAGTEETDLGCRIVARQIAG